MKQRQSVMPVSKIIIQALIWAAMLGVTVAAFAQDSKSRSEEQTPTPYYRVEVILFNHVDGQSDRYRTPDITDYSAALDPLRLAEALQSATDSLARFERLSSSQRGAADIPETNESTTEDSMPEPYLAQQALSETMQSVLNRLDRSARYQPITWRSWYQTAESGETTFWVRIHDNEPIAWNTDKRAEAVEESMLALADTSVNPLSNSDVEEPVQHYQLDGQTRLRQRQFMHFQLDLEWREPARRPAPLLTSDSHVENLQTAGHAEPAKWLVHPFAQSRIVRVDRIEYFDSALIGAVILLTRSDPDEPQTAAEPDDVESTDE